MRRALLAFLVASSAWADPLLHNGVRLLDEGVSKGYVSEINCVGTSIACTRAGQRAALTITVTAGPTTDDAVQVGNGTVAQDKVLPSCSNATTSKLLYNTSTNTWSCGTDQDTVYTLPALAASTLGGVKGTGSAIACTSTDKVTGFAADGTMQCGTDNGGGVTTMAAVGSSPNANGASISGSTLTLQPADGSNPGVVTTGTQTIAGAKTLSGNLSLSSGSLLLTATGSSNELVSSTADATTSSTVGSFKLRPSGALTANDLLFDLRNGAGTPATVFSIDYEGDVKANSYQATNGVSILSNIAATAGAEVGTTIDTANAINGSNDKLVAFKVAGSEVLAIMGGGQLQFQNVNLSIRNSSGKAALSGGDGDSTYLTGEATNGSTAVGVFIGNQTALSTAGARIAKFTRDQASTVKSAVDINGFYLPTVQTVTVANDGNAGTAPASTITPSSPYIDLAYNDPQNGSVGTISETGAQAGSIITVTHIGSGGTVTFTEVAGQQEIGATACTLGLSDTFQAIYTNSSWHFLSCRDN